MGKSGSSENAISTFRRSIQDGAVFLEMDVARTADGADPDCSAITTPSSYARVPFRR